MMENSFKIKYKFQKSEYQVQKTDKKKVKNKVKIDPK